MIGPKEQKFSGWMFFVAILIVVGYNVVTEREVVDFVFLLLISLDFLRYHVIRKKECSKF